MAHINALRFDLLRDDDRFVAMAAKKTWRLVIVVRPTG
jgi:hypothetical protein